MPEDAPDSVRVECASCGGRFRIRRRPGGALPDQIRCPRCNAAIRLADKAGPRGWVETRQHQPQPSHHPDSDPTDSGFHRRNQPEHTSDRPAPSRDSSHDNSWEFRSARDARKSSSSIFTEESDVESGMTTVDHSDSTPEETSPDHRSPDQTSGQPPGAKESEREARRAEQSTFASGNSRIEKLENVDQSDPDAVMTPLPANSIIADEPDVDESDSATATAPGKPLEETDEQERPPSAAAIARGEADTAEASDFEQSEPSDADAPQTGDPESYDWNADEPLFVRVDEGTEREVSRDELLGLLREGVWVEAVEVRPADASTWISLRRHPVWDDIRDEIVGHSRQIMLEGPGAPPTDTSPRETEDPTTSPDEDREEPTESEPQTSQQSQTNQQTQSNDDVAWYRSALVILLVVVSLLTLSLTAVLIWVSTGGPLGGILTSSDARRANAVPASDTGTAIATTGSTSPDASTEPESTSSPDLPDLPEGASAMPLAERSVARALDPVLLARGYLNAGHPEAARRRALDVLARGELAEHTPAHPSERQTARARRVFRKAIDQDPALRQSVVTIGHDVQPQKLHALGGGWSITFRFTRRGRSLWAFKPAQKDWEQGWKAEIASWLLCEVVACHFNIPRNRPARISKKTFETLYDRVDDREQTSYRERFDALIWKTETGPDGQKKKYLYGTLKDWVPSFARWPIEYKSTWRPWLSAKTAPTILEQPVRRALKPLRQKISDDWWNRIEQQLDGATTRSLARQISSLMVFDWVATNWDRFSNFEEYYGVNNQFADGHFVSIDNGAAFAYNDFGEVMARFSDVQRYSRQTIASLRALNRDTMNPVLFPNPTDRGKKRLRRFWAQRSRLLERIANLKTEYGTNTIMAFQ